MSDNDDLVSAAEAIVELQDGKKVKIDGVLDADGKAIWVELERPMASRGGSAVMVNKLKSAGITFAGSVVR